MIPLEKVQLRAFSLAAVCCRCDLEEDENIGEAEAIRQDLMTWLTQHKVADEMESPERRFLDTPTGQLAKHEILDMSWRAEGLAILCWFLNRCELPHYDRQSSAGNSADALGFFGEPIVIHSARTKSEVEELDRALEGVHTRISQFMRTGEIWEKSAASFVSWFGENYARFVRVQDGDLALHGSPVSRAEVAVLQECMSIVKEQRIATGWLLGRNRVYSQVPTDM
jgi:uncharacterized protein DUF4272